MYSDSRNIDMYASFYKSIFHAQFVQVYRHAHKKKYVHVKPVTINPTSMVD